MDEVEELICVKIEYCEGDLKIQARAIIADAALVYAQSMYEPEEYGPGLCETSLVIYDYEEDLVLTEENILTLIKEHECIWTLVERDS